MSPSRTLIPFEHKMLEPVGWIGSLQHLLGYASLPLRLRAALQELHRTKQSNSYCIRYIESSPVWQYYFWGKLIVSELSYRDEIEREERIQDLEIWLSQSIGTIDSFASVTIEPYENLFFINELFQVSKNSSLTGSLLNIILSNLRSPTVLFDKTLQKWLGIAINGLDCEVTAEEVQYPPITQYYISFIDPEITGTLKLTTAKVDLGWQAFEDANLSGNKVNWTQDFPFLGQRHATLYWAGKRFWLQAHATHLLYTYNGTSWEWLGPLEVRPLPQDETRDSGHWYILLGHINQYHQPLPGSVIMEFHYARN